MWDATSDPERSPQLRAIAAAGGVDCILCVFTLVRVRVCMTHARRPWVAVTWHWQRRYCCGGRIHPASAGARADAASRAERWFAHAGAGACAPPCLRVRRLNTPVHAWRRRSPQSRPPATKRPRRASWGCFDQAVRHEVKVRFHILTTRKGWITQLTPRATRHEGQFVIIFGKVRFTPRVGLIVLQLARHTRCKRGLCELAVGLCTLFFLPRASLAGHMLQAISCFATMGAMIYRRIGLSAPGSTRRSRVGLLG